VTKIKKDLIHKAKVKKAYAKIKEREQQPDKDGEVGENGKGENTDGGEAEEGKMHPTRELMLKDEEVAQSSSRGEEAHSDGFRRRTRRPGYYDKQLTKAADTKALAEERARERERRMAERAEKIAEREKFKKAMAKTRDRHGNKKLGRESTLLLDKVKRVMADDGKR
jgi:hypothetical protein